MRKLFVFATIAALLLGFNLAAHHNEQLMQNGDIVLLELAPVDPRALLMGDYMALNYRIAREVSGALHAAQDRTGAVSDRERRRNLPGNGTAIVRLDQNSVAAFARLDDGSPLARDEHRLFFRVRNSGVRLAAAAYFFQEGYAKDYARARYGELRVDKNGRNLLVHMRDENRERIEPEKMKAKTATPSR